MNGLLKRVLVPLVTLVLGVWSACFAAIILSEDIPSKLAVSSGYLVAAAFAQCAIPMIGAAFAMLFWLPFWSTKKVFVPTLLSAVGTGCLSALSYELPTPSGEPIEHPWPLFMSILLSMVWVTLVFAIFIPFRHAKSTDEEETSLPPNGKIGETE